MGLDVPLRVVARSEYLRVPVLGWYMRFCRQIALDREDAASVQAMLAACGASLRAGISVLLFPEGTRSPDAALGRFHRGAFRVARDTGTPVLPVVVYGNHKILRKGSCMPMALRQRVVLEVLPPVAPDGLPSARVLSERVRDRMAEALDRIRAEVG
jgi:1-acyl-sn-glycerol-3-phosphate acyltransferase